MSTPQDPAANAADNTTIQKINSQKAATTYANFVRGALTPEEIILDFGFNANSFGVKVLEEDLDITNRIILSPSAGKRLLLLLNDMVRRHEANFGEVEVDFRRRLKPQPDAGGRPPVG